MTVKIEAKDLSKVYPSRSGPMCALRDFSLRVAEGEFVCIVGPSGCGKSTFLCGMREGVGWHSAGDEVFHFQEPPDARV
jgi:ABC-type lipoprotein export system ATPase subunit